MAAQMSASAALVPYDLWSKLPCDPLGVVYDKVASPLGRVRFAAVCRSWRTVTLCHPSVPTFPWLVLPPAKDGMAENLYCPVDGALLHVPLPPKLTGKRLVGFHGGGWITATSDVNGGSSLVIVNIFSGIEVPLSAKQRTTPAIRKIVFSKDPTSKRCILAAIFPSGLAVCRVGCRKRGWWLWYQYHGFSDISFCHGKLYGVDNNNLNIFNVLMTYKGSPVITTTYKLSVNKGLNFIAWEESNFIYIVNHGDKLLMAVRARWLPEHEYSFKVFEVVNTTNSTTNEHMWAEVAALDNHALFLGATCSTAVHVPEGRRGDIKGNHIYYNYIRLPKESRDSICDDLPLIRCDYGDYLYRREDQKSSGADGVTSIGYSVTDSRHALAWFLPPDF